MSRTPNSRKQETHERIVDVAARAIGANADGRAMLSAARKALIQQYDAPHRTSA